MSFVLSQLATYTISPFCLVYAADQADLSLEWLQTLKTDFLATWPIGYKTFSMLNSTEHEMSTAHKN